MDEARGTSMAAMTAPTKRMLNANIHRCHHTGLSPWKSTLQNVTKSTKNIKTGNRASITGAKNAAAPSSTGTNANTKYNTAPNPMATGSVQSFRKRTISISLLSQL